MARTIKASLITNICDHYSVRLFELLAQRFEMMYYFTGVGENYRRAKARSVIGNFVYKNLKGIYILPRVRISPGVIGLLFKRQDVFIKSVDDRFALPAVFLVSRVLRKPFILWTGIWQHPSTSFHKFSFWFMRYIYRHAEAILVYGEHIKKYLISLGIDEKKIFCAPHAVDNVKFNVSINAEQKQALRKELGILDQKVVLFIGRLEECKGLKYLIEAMRLASVSDAVLLIIGNGPAEAEYKKQCNDAGINVKFLGYIRNDRLMHYYAIAEVFVLPSITTEDFKEPWGLVVNEAMNQGCPVIASDAVGAAAGGLVIDGVNGFIVPERDAALIANRLKIVLTSTDVQAQMSSNARKEILNWTQEQMVCRFKMAIEHVLKS